MEFEGEVSSEKERQQGASYTYWVRKITEGAAPLPVPQKLTPEDVRSCKSQPATLEGSVWNRAGTWEEKSLNNWAAQRIKDLLISVSCLPLAFGRAEVEDVTKCVGDAFMVIVRNKKRVGYTYELTLKVKGGPTFEFDTNKKLTDTGGLEFKPGYSNLLLIVGKIIDPKLDIDGQQIVYSLEEVIECYLNEMEVRLSDAGDLLDQDKVQISNDLKLFLQPIREKLLQFEQEMKDM